MAQHTYPASPTLCFAFMYQTQTTVEYHAAALQKSRMRALSRHGLTSSTEMRRREMMIYADCSDGSPGAMKETEPVKGSSNYRIFMAGCNQQDICASFLQYESARPGRQPSFKHVSSTSSHQRNICYCVCVHDVNISDWGHVSYVVLQEFDIRHYCAESTDVYTMLSSCAIRRWVLLKSRLLADWRQQ